jgi:O-methyltransferase
MRPGDSRLTEIRRTVTDPDQCEFYHIVELPDGTLTTGQWDLRDGVADYLGGVDFAGKSVLEIGPASGFLSFHMERQGATVTAVEPPMDRFWDLVPRAGADIETQKRLFRSRIERVRNSFWYLHGLHRSQVRLFDANAYDLPAALGTFDCGLLAAVLLHCSSPVRMLDSLSRRVSQTIVVCDVQHDQLGHDPVCSLVPTAENDTIDTWWAFTPEFFVNYLGVLGFRDVRIVRHRQLAHGHWTKLFTVVANRL